MPLLRRIVAFLTLSLIAGWVYLITLSSEQISAKKGQFKFSRDSLLPVLPVEIGGRTYPFVLDTGTSVTVYDATLRPFLGEPVESGVMNTPQGECNVIFYSSPRARMGPFNLPANSPVLCIDLGGLRKCFKENIYGCLGMDFLRDHVFKIDFYRGEITFLRLTVPNSGVRIPITFDDSLPLVQATIPGLLKPEVFLVDTGSAHMGHGNLRDELFDSLCEKRVLIPAGQQRIVTFSGSKFRRQGRLQKITLGCFSQQKLLFCRSFNGNSLGINYWSRYIITFDCPNEAIYLKEKCGITPRT